MRELSKWSLVFFKGICLSFEKKILCIGAGFILWNNHSDNSTRNEDSIITKDLLRTNNYLLSLFLCAVILFLSVNQL